MDTKLPINYRLLRWLVFKIGDIRWLGWKDFPFVITWDVHYHKISLNEVDECKAKLEIGDIVLHRDSGFLSNLSIGGIMIHAGIVVPDENGKPTQIVEAISEGVVKRNVGHILYSDYACVVRPKLSFEYKIDACMWADKIVGSEYDVQFNFNTEEERKSIEKGNKERFCCTEIPHFCYLDHIKELGVFRKRNIGFATKFLSLIGLNPGTAIVTADMYVEALGLDIVWMSQSYTHDWAKSMGASEQHLFKIAKYILG